MDPTAPIPTAAETSKTLLSPSAVNSEPSPPPRSALSVAKTGLFFLMATLTIVFSMLLSSYLIGRNEPGWQALPQLNILWLNTLWLILSSVMLEWSRRLANQSQTTSSSIGSTARIALLAAGAFSLFFLMGQWLAWQELDRAGFFLGAHLSSSFFFLLTGLHGLHLIGGLVAWGWATLKISLEKDSLALGRIELCALYWHFLLLVWLVMFGLLWLAK